MKELLLPTIEVWPLMVDFEGYLKQLPADSRVLDVGCAWGDITAKIARRVPAGFVLGVDTWYQAIIQAIQRHPQGEYPNLRFALADARRLKLKESPFDLVVSRGCLHYLDHPGKAFSAIAKNLKSGGRMLVWCLGQGNALKINQVMLGLTKRDRWRPYFEHFQPTRKFATPVSCLPWLSAARLRKNHAFLATQEIKFPDRESFLQWVGWNWSGHFQRVPPTKNHAFANDFLTAYCPSAEGPFQAETVWLTVDATKK